MVAGSCSNMLFKVFSRQRSLSQSHCIGHPLLWLRKCDTRIYSTFGQTLFFQSELRPGGGSGT